MTRSTTSTNTARPDHDPLVLPPDARATLGVMLSNEIRIGGTYKSRNERFAADLTFPDGRPREDRSLRIVFRRDLHLMHSPRLKEEYRAMQRKSPASLRKAYADLRKDARFAAVRLEEELRRTECSLFAWRYKRRLPLMRFEDEMMRVIAPNHEEFVRSRPNVDIVPEDVWRLTFVHRAKIDPTKVACYPTLADARRKREVVMSMGRFLTQAFPHLSASDVQARSEKWIAQGQPIKMHVILNDEPDADPGETSDHWVRVYRNPHGFSSCMAEFDDTPYHPARFYARPGNHLGLAYLTANNDPFGPVTARCIVNTHTRTYVRVYGDSRLAKALENPDWRAYAGPDAIAYRLDSHRALEGVVCNRIEHNGRIVAPYLDNIKRIRLEADHCIITRERSTHECTEHSGFSRPVSGVMCGGCGGYCDEDDMRYSDYHDMSICEYCRDNNYSYAYVNGCTQDWVNNNEVIHLNDGAYLNKPELLEAHGFVWSQDEYEWLDIDDAVYLSYMGDYVSYGNTVALDRPTPEGDERARECDTTTITLDGEELTVHEDYDGL